MLSEDEDNHNLDVVESREADEALRSRSQNENSYQNDVSYDNQLSKNQSDILKSDQDSEPVPEQISFEPNESQKQFLIKFQKPTKNQTQFGTSPQLEIKPKLPLQTLYPWLNQKTLLIDNPLIKLHNQIIDYFLTFQQAQQTHNYLLFTFNKLRGLLYKNFKNCDVLAPFLTNRVYLKNSEVQIFILFDSSSWRSSETIEKVRECLEKLLFTQIRFFESQPQKGKEEKVGFNCVTQQKNYQVQIKLVTQEWISYLSMISDVMENSLEGKYLHLIFDTMIRQRLLQNGVKGYLLFGMIALFIQQRKRQRSRSLTENLLKFLEYFGMGPFDERKIVYIPNRGEFEIAIDPSQHGGIPQFSFWISPNIDISNHTVKQFFGLLKNRYRLISSYNFARSESILWPLLNPSQDEFRY